MTHLLLLTNKVKIMVWKYIIVAVFFIILLSGLLSSCAVVKTDFSSKANKDATVYYYLPESIIKIRSTAKIAVYYNPDTKGFDGSSKIIEQSFVPTTEMIADTRNLLSLNYIANALMADSIKYVVNSKGLLETINITTEDRTSDIISKLAEAPRVILGTPTSVIRATDLIVKIKEFSTDFVVKASSVSNTQLSIPWNIIIPNEMGKDEFITISADFKISSTDSSANIPTLSDLLKGTPKSEKSEIVGILTRPIKNIQLKFESATKGYVNPLPYNLVISDVTRLITIPIKRSAFAKRTNTVGIKDGIIQSNEITKSSSVEGFVSIPINIAKAIVSIPGQLFQFKYDNTKNLDELEKLNLNYEKSIQESQKFALTKEQELEKVKLDIQKTNSSNQIELLKLQFELQTILINAEKTQLESQKALNALKKEIEELK